MRLTLTHNHCATYLYTAVAVVKEILELLRKKMRQFYYVAFAFANTGTAAAPNAHDRTASRHLSEVKHVPAQLALRWVAASGKRVSFSVLVCCGYVGTDGDGRFDFHVFSGGSWR